MKYNKRYLIPILLKLLDKEITVSENSNSRIVINVLNGQFMGKKSKNYIYKFTLDNPIHPIDGIQIELLTDNKTVAKGFIVEAFEHDISIALENEIGKFIHKAKIEIMFSLILKKLKENIKETYSSKKYLEFHVANHFFEENSIEGSLSSIIPGFESLIAEYNQTKDAQGSNKKISNVDFPDNIRMAAHIIGAFAKTNMKILVVSNNNNFINNLTVCLADNLIDHEFYKNGKIVNQVAQEDNDIFKDHELVIPKRIIKRLKGISNQEKAVLIRKMKSIDGNLIKLSQGLKLIQNRDDYFKKIKQLTKDAEIIEQKIPDIEKAIIKQEKQFAYLANKIKTQKSHSFVSNLLMRSGLDPVQKKFSATQKDLENKKQELSNINERYQQLEIQRKNTTNSLQNIHNDIFAFLGKMNLSENKLNEQYTDLISQRNAIKTKITDLDNEVKLITSHVLTNAVILGTTLNMTFLSNEFDSLKFDLLVVDKPTSSSEPQLYWALSKCKMAAIVVDDFLSFVVPPTSLGD